MQEGRGEAGADDVWVECRPRAFSSAFETRVRSAFGACAFAFAGGH